MKIISRKSGVFLIVTGILMQFLNIITYGYWEIDIDIPGVFILIIGIMIMTVGWKK